MHSAVIAFEDQFNLPSPIQSFQHPTAEALGIQIKVKRDDLIHEFVSGNKWRKLKYIINDYYYSECSGIVSFGGIHSNHLHALSFVCAALNIDFIALIREGNQSMSPTLDYIRSKGHEIIVVSRDSYRKMRGNEQITSKRFPGMYIIPEGGKSKLAVTGVQEMVNEWPGDLHFDYCIGACGTGTTMVSLAAKMVNTLCLGFYSFKKPFLEKELNEFASLHFNQKLTNLQLIGDYHFGGFGNANEDLINFMKSTFLNFRIPLDPIYNAKSFFGFEQMMKDGFFKPESNILMIHSGGLQGLGGFKERYQINLPY